MRATSTALATARATTTRTRTARAPRRDASRVSRRRARPTRALGESLSTYLTHQAAIGTVDGDLAVALNSIAVACKRVRALVAKAPIAGMTGSAGGSNASGDEQKKLDVVANDVFVETLSSCGRAGVIVTEEEDTPIAVERVGSKDGGGYVVTFDPIDGSSNIDACVTTGSIFGVYAPGECEIKETDTPEQTLENCLTNAKQSGEALVAAGYCMYSSSCVFVLTVGDGVYQFDYDDASGEFLMTRERMQIPDGKDMQRIYSCNNGNVNLWEPELKEFVEYLQDGGSEGGKPWSYRYIGALVADAHRTLSYGGLWLYPGDSNAPEGKARLLYEIAPVSMLAEQAGGISMRGAKADERVLEVTPEHIHQKSPMFVGSASAVRDLQEFLKSK
jgi:fructose-1,6-bisphosphatase I|tara:strand:- start:3873 stop:5039 length:1167 start_codon:yes stop_codon:yes gene_type:complete